MTKILLVLTLIHILGQFDIVTSQNPGVNRNQFDVKSFRKYVENVQNQAKDQKDVGNIVTGPNPGTNDNHFDVYSLQKHVEHIHTVAKGFTAAKNNPDPLINLYSAFSNNFFGMDGITDLAEMTLSKISAIQYNVSSTCLKNFNQTLLALLNREMWALRMIDSNAKPPSGILEFKTKWVGSHQECVNTKAEVYENPVTKEGLTHPFSGQYCNVYLPVLFGQIVPQIPVVTFEMAMCFPDTCSSYDASVLVNLLFEVIPLNLLPPGAYAYASCKEEFPDELSTKAIIVIVVSSIFATIMTLATLYDLFIVHGHLFHMFGCVDEEEYDEVEVVDTKETTPLISDVTMSSSYTQNGAVSHYKKDCEKVHLDLGQKKTPVKKTKQPNSYKPGTLGRLLLSFSIYTNTLKIFNTSQPAGALTSVNGIRFLSMTWVILGHTYAFGQRFIENTAYVGEVYGRFTFQAVANATVSVDSFFTLSGLLVAYLSLKEMEKRGGALKFRWDLYYFHRFWRLTPPYMLVLMVYVPLFKYLYSGPFWTDISKDECEDTWWKNLIYVNNLVKPEDQCMGWSWYLANDMQFYVLSPLLIVPLYYSGILGSLVCLAFLAATVISTALVSRHKKLSAADQPFNDLYIKPWIRMGPYIVGIFTGYILYRTKCKLKMHKLLNMLGWCVATALALAVLYGLYREEGQSRPNLEVSTLYNATFRTAWGISVAWLVFACANGYGGPVNALLSWNALIPLSRLSYCAYLVHPVVMFLYYYSRQTYMFWSDLEIIYLFIGHTVLSYATAFVASLAFEAPMMGLEKVILGREKNS